MPSDRTMKAYRLPADTIRQIEEIGEHHHGLSGTAVLEWAVTRLHEFVFAPPAPLPAGRKRVKVTRHPRA